MEIDQHPLLIRPGWINAAGTLGIAPPAYWPLPHAPSAFITNPISYEPRRPAQDRGIFQLTESFLIHTGWPSPGFRVVLRQNRERWARSQVPIWVHLMGDESEHVEIMSRQLEEVEGVEAIEMSFAHSARANEILDLVRRASGELPLVLNLPIDRIGEAWIQPALGLGVTAISLGAPRGALLNGKGKPIHGRMYGPSFLLLATAAMEKLLEFRVPIIAGGGVMRQAEIDDLLQAGAAAVQLDFVLWRGWQNEPID